MNREKLDLNERYVDLMQQPFLKKLDGASNRDKLHDLKKDNASKGHEIKSIQSTVTRLSNERADLDLKVEELKR